MFIWYKILTMCPSLAATKHTRPPLKNVPFREPKADNAAAKDMIQPQLPNTLFLWNVFTSLREYYCICERRCMKLFVAPEGAV